MVCTSLFSVYLPWLLTCSRLGLAENPPWREGPDEEVLYRTVDGDRRGDSSDMTPLRTAAVTATTAAEENLTTATTRIAENGDVLSAAADHAGEVTGPVEKPAARWSHIRTFKVAMVVFPLFFIANFSYNVSLAHTSVTSNTIISTTSSLWTFLFR